MAILLTGCHHAGPNLSFYIVNNEQVPGGRFIDTADFPKLGYIATAPDLVIRSLSAATLETTDPYSSNYPAIIILMRPDDAQQFAALTKRATGRKVLLMLGDTALTAPRVMEPVTNGSVALSFGGPMNSKKVADDLKRLVQ